MHVDGAAGYRVPLATSSTLALFDTYQHNNGVQFVADQAADKSLHGSDVKMTSSTGSQSSQRCRDVIVAWFICASVVHRLQISHVSADND